MQQRLSKLEAAQRLGVSPSTLDPRPDDTAGGVGD